MSSCSISGSSTTSEATSSDSCASSSASTTPESSQVASSAASFSAYIVSASTCSDISAPRTKDTFPGRTDATINTASGFASHFRIRPPFVLCFFLIVSPFRCNEMCKNSVSIIPPERFVKESRYGNAFLSSISFPVRIVLSRLSFQFLKITADVVIIRNILACRFPVYRFCSPGYYIPVLVTKFKLIIQQHFILLVFYL